MRNESNAVEVNCVPGSDGGLPQHFLLEVRGSLKNSVLFQTPQTLLAPQSDQGAVGEVPPIYRESNPRPIFLLRDLDPGLDYAVSVYAVNEQGKSKPLLLDNVRMPVVEFARDNDKLTRHEVFLQDLKSAPRDQLVTIAAFVGKHSFPFFIFRWREQLLSGQNFKMGF